ncbi:MAG: polysaccharide deacetylase family protein [Acidobacteriota bacterium]
MQLPEDWNVHRIPPSETFAILTYHRIAPYQHPLTLPVHLEANIVLPPETFTMHLSVLKRKANVISLDLALQLSKAHGLPERAVVLTFDDGFREHFDDVADRLTMLQMEATFFITGYGIYPEFGLRWIEWIGAAHRMLPSTREISIAGNTFLIGGKSDISLIRKYFRHLDSIGQRETLSQISRDLGLPNEEFDLLRDQLFPSMDKLMQLRGVEYLALGGHSLSHPSLSSLSGESKRDEILGSLEMLQALAPDSAHSFAYPFGGIESYDAECRSIIKEAGFRCACTSVPGLNSAETPVFDLKRFDMNKFDINEVLEAFP